LQLFSTSIYPQRYLFEPLNTVFSLFNIFHRTAFLDFPYYTRICLYEFHNHDSWSLVLGQVANALCLLTLLCLWTMIASKRWIGIIYGRYKSASLSFWERSCRYGLGLAIERKFIGRQFGNWDFSGVNYLYPSLFFLTRKCGCRLEIGPEHEYEVLIFFHVALNCSRDFHPCPPTPVLDLPPSLQHQCLFNAYIQNVPDPPDLTQHLYHRFPSPKLKSQSNSSLVNSTLTSENPYPGAHQTGTLHMHACGRRNQRWRRAFSQRRAAG
jgi:hypothetical protein